MNALYALVAVAILFLIAYLGIAGADLRFVFGILVPYAAIALFVLGFIYRVLKWARSAVPFFSCATSLTLPSSATCKIFPKTQSVT